MATRGTKPDGRTEGFMLLALICALMVMGIWMAVAMPDVRVQAQREVEADMLYAGDQMAEAIARYYSSGRLNTAGLVIKTPPPPYGYLDELRKLRDGVNLGLKQVRFVRGSAFIDPITHEEWDPVRVGDPRIKKFLLAWSRSTGRPIPQSYLSYVGLISTDDIENPEGEDDKPADGTRPTLKPGTQPLQPPVVGDDEEDEDDDWDDEGEDDEGDEEEDDELDKAISGGSSDHSPFLRVALQGLTGGQQGQTGGQQGVAPVQTPGVGRPLQRPRPAPLFGAGGGKNPIIGVVSKSKMKAVRTRFGIETHDEMLFIYMPPPPRGTPRLGPQQNPGQPNPRGPGAVREGDVDGIPDDLVPVKPTTPTTPTTP